MEPKRTRNNKYQNGQLGNRCYRCGFLWSSRHFCPAYDQQCFKCGRDGHFGRMCLSRSPHIQERQVIKPRVSRARDQRRMEEFIHRKSLMMTLPFADLDSDHLTRWLYTKAPKEILKVTHISPPRPVSNTDVQTQTTSNTVEISSQTEPDSATTIELQRMQGTVSSLRDEAAALRSSCADLLNKGQQEFSSFKKKTKALAETAMQQKIYIEKLKRQLEESRKKENDIEELKSTIQQHVPCTNRDSSSQTDIVLDFADPLFTAEFFQHSRLCDLPFLNDILPNNFSSSSILPVNISFGTKVFSRDIKLSPVLKHQRKLLSEDLSRIYFENGDIQSTFVVKFNHCHYRLMDKVPLGTLPPFIFDRELRMTMVLHDHHNNVYFCDCDFDNTNIEGNEEYESNGDAYHDDCRSGPMYPPYGPPCPPPRPSNYLPFSGHY